MNIESIINNLDVLTDSKNGVQRLREFIRDLAIKGQLIENPDKSISGTVGSHSPLPSSWRWVKIEEVADFVNGFAFRSDEYVSNGVGVVRMSDMKNGEISPVGMKFVSADRLKSLDSNFQVKPNDIVMGMTGATLGKPCVNRTSEVFLLNQRIGKFVPKDIDPDYLLLALANLENSFMRLSFGTGVNNLSTRQIKDSLLPLPPRGMQSEIVKAVGEMYRTCDKLESGLNSKRNLARLSRKSAINSISTAHTGDELDIAWDRVQQNWEVMAGTPESVKDIRRLIVHLGLNGSLTKNFLDFHNKSLGEIATLINGRAYKQQELLQSGIPVIRIQNLNGGNNWFYSNLELPMDKKCVSGDLLFAWSASFGPYIWNGPEAIYHYHIWKVVPSSYVTRDYLYYLLQDKTEEIKSASHGLAMLHMTKSGMESMMVSIPSIEQQNQAVHLIKELLGICDELETCLIARGEFSRKLSCSIVSASA